MSKKVSDLVACVVDKGLFLHVAQELSKSYSKVFYWSPWEEAFPMVSKGIIGDGFGPNLIRVPNFWDVKEECDLFVFTDIGFSGEQRELLRQQIPVWGHHGADILEANRGQWLDALDEVGLDVPPHIRIKGLTALKDHLRDKEDKYIKISKWRGDWETFHWRSFDEDEVHLDCHAYQLGPVKELLTYYVFDPIDTDIEDGTDSYCIKAQWPKRCIHGMERKDKAYLCAIQEVDKVHQRVREVNDAMGPLLHERFGLLGPFSTEVRLKGDKAYPIDPTIRFGSPPSQVQMELIGNWPEIIWHGANGELVEPQETVPGELIGAQIRIMGDKEPGEWATLKMPAELKPFVKSSFSCEVHGTVRIAPNLMQNWMGWLTATGATIEEVIELLKERKEMLPDGLDCDISPIGHLLKEMSHAEKEDVVITDQTLPSSSVAIEASL